MEQDAFFPVGRFTDVDFLKGNVQQMTVCREEEIVIKADHFLRNYCSVTFNNCFFEQTAFCAVLILFLIKY